MFILALVHTFPFVIHLGVGINVLRNHLRRSDSATEWVCASARHRRCHHPGTLSVHIHRLRPVNLESQLTVREGIF